ncbi:AraC family transcriptional regulator [Paenibacillus sp. YYML68]|uniref:helix-turn-helix domain-containing protein n=1 Tax=Paenibacillus sp. YYML68 TaxID=2909250 RepID=UPI00248FA9C5|nr:AraC family transcriptional regulator [Paenibacillus sp. YYML68]
MNANLLACGYAYHRERYYGMDKHGAPNYLFRLQTEGRAKAYISHQWVPIEAGDLILVQPGDSYALLIEEETDTNGVTIPIVSGDYYLFCNGSWISEWWQRSHKPGVTRIDPDDKLISLWQQLIIEKRRLGKTDGSELTDYLLRAMCLYLERAVTETTPSHGRSFSAMRMKRYIEERATQSFKVEDVASHVGLSVSRAVHLYKECFGQTMLEYALHLRLSAAIERMLYTSMSLEQIALTCGFGGYSYFHRVFKEHHGIAPGQYRTEQKKSL